ncbi:MAG: glutamate racemase [Spirochaetes bacterium]|nr:glutamate racemase [Spirochaetota bacterium]
MSKDLCKGPIGVFDSGYGGMTILREFVRTLPGYDFIYLGDNARTPYGNRSFETIYAYTLDAVKLLFGMDCPLVILACNTASSRALRTIQQRDLPVLAPSRRVLGVIRPTVEVLDALSKTKHLGVMGTLGTVSSNSYPLEINKLFPHIILTQEPCPIWVPLVENGEIDNPGSDYFVKQHLDRIMERDPQIDVLLLACTHYPLLLNSINRHAPPGVTIVPQDRIVAESLSDYLSRHREIDERCTRNGAIVYYTTDSTEMFDASCRSLFGIDIESKRIAF